MTDKAWAHALADGRPLPAHRPDAAAPTACARCSPTWWPMPACRARTSASRAACSTATAAALPDAMLEIWQADAQGRYAHPADGRPLASNSFRGFGRAPPTRTAASSSPPSSRARCQGPGGGPQAPHINVGLFARGILKRLFTRIYFAGDPANANDPILALVPAERRATLMAKPDPPSPASGASTSTCRAPTRRCSSTRRCQTLRV